MKADDYFAIQRLIFSYPRFLDRGDLKAMGELFKHATVYFEDGRVIVNDADKVAEIFREFVQIYPDGTPRTRHLTSNLIIDPIDDYLAAATSYVVVFQQTDELALQPIITGDYQDKFVKVHGVWRFSERYICNDLFGDLSAHGKYQFG